VARSQPNFCSLLVINWRKFWKILNKSFNYWLSSNSFLTKVATEAGITINASAVLPSPSSAKVKESEAQEANVQIVNYAGINLNDTGNNTDINKTSTYFSGLDPTEELADVQVVHEWEVIWKSVQLKKIIIIWISTDIIYMFRHYNSGHSPDRESRLRFHPFLDTLHLMDSCPLDRSLKTDSYRMYNTLAINQLMVMY